MAVATMQGIIGCRADYDGLIIDPAIPKKWRGFSLQRVYRGVTYQITVKNPLRVSKGVRYLVVDGRQFLGCRIPYNPAKKGRTVRVVAVMG